MKKSNNIVALAKELGLERKTLYRWRWQLDPESGTKAAEPTAKAKLEQRVMQLERALADKTMEVDFFKGALQRIEARRQASKDSGGKTSTTKSGK
jgi:hypothetical protein